MGARPEPAASTPVPSRAWRNTFEATAFQSFLAGLKRHWGDALYREVVARAEALDAPDAETLERAMRGDASYRLYAWLERRIQQMKWSGRHGFSTLVAADRERFAKLLAAATATPSPRLRLDPSFVLPDYVRETETHQQPGGLWRDPVNAYALAWYTTGLSFAGTNPDELVDWYARLVAARCAEIGLVPRDVLDAGCTAGRSTRAIKRAMPDATVTGCDVCEGSLRLGHLRSIEEGADVTLVQTSVESLAFPDASFDVVASHWLWHELPPRAIRASIAEARRVLRPGGLFVAYDMLVATGGATGKWLLSGYAARNNEPFAHTLLDFDARGALAAAGFVDVRLVHSMPQHPGPEAPAGLPPRRLHPMSFLSARLPG